MNGKDPDKKDKVAKKCKKKCTVKTKDATDVEVSANNTDVGGNFYIYNMYAASGEILALNRYVYKDTSDQPFDTLTAEEELVLNLV